MLNIPAYALLADFGSRNCVVILRIFLGVHANSIHFDNSSILLAYDITDKSHPKSKVSP